MNRQSEGQNPSRPTMRLPELANRLLTNEELALANRLNYLVKSGKMRQAWTLLEQVLPKFWKEERGAIRTLWPDNVYRTLYYLDEPYDYVRVPRHMINLMGAHLEGLLDLVSDYHYGLPLGGLVNKLMKTKQLPEDIARQLIWFNNAAYKFAKHPGADPFLPTRLDERRFSTRESILCLMITRQISMKLFDLLRNRGKSLPEEWKQIQAEWLTWDREGPILWDVIPLREHIPPEWFTRNG